jgi:hypothetical protein
MFGRPVEPPPTDFEQVGYAAVPQRPRTGMAVAALVCGILGLVPCGPLLGIVGLILGIIAALRARREPQRYGGKGMAIGGICTGGLSILLLPVVIAIVLPGMARSNELTNRAISQSNLRGIGMAIKLYANDNASAFPPDFQALIADGSCVPKQLTNPNSGRSSGCDYYYVTGLTSGDPKDWIIAFEDPNQNRGEGASVLYVNGTVQFIVEKPGGQFTREISRFKAEYEKKRGEPPVIIPPH